MSETIPQPPLLILFDGPCGLCNWLVRFLKARDPHGRFRFAPLQSKQGQEQLATHQIDSAIQSVVVIEADKAYMRSAAVCRIAVELPDPWPLLGSAIFLPQSIRDGIYDWIAANRKSWFSDVPGDACALNDE